MTTLVTTVSKAVSIEINDKELFKSKLVGDLRESVKLCTESLDEITYLRKKLIQEIWPDFDWLSQELDFFWECPDSPAGWCVYHRWEDPPHDHCLFCGDPSERK